MRTQILLAAIAAAFLTACGAPPEQPAPSEPSVAEETSAFQRVIAEIEQGEATRETWDRLRILEDNGTPEEQAEFAAATEGWRYPERLDAIYRAELGSSSAPTTERACTKTCQTYPACRGFTDPMECGTGCDFEWCAGEPWPREPRRVRDPEPREPREPRGPREPRPRPDPDCRPRQPC